MKDNPTNQKAIQKSYHEINSHLHIANRRHMTLCYSISILDKYCYQRFAKSPLQYVLKTQSHQNFFIGFVWKYSRLYSYSFTYKQKLKKFYFMNKIIDYKFILLGIFSFVYSTQIHSQRSMIFPFSNL